MKPNLPPIRISGFAAQLTTMLLAAFLTAGAQQRQPLIPSYEVDPSWPKPLPNGWSLGPVTSVAVDSRDHVWITHAPGGRGPEAAGKVFAPLVIELDQQGNYVGGWTDGPGYSLSDVPHGIFIDRDDHVWVAARTTHQLLEFTRDGKLLLTIGESGVTRGSNDSTHLGMPAGMWVDPVANEVFVADGYRNRRVVVFNTKTGQYLRHWGAYGGVPDDAGGGRGAGGGAAPAASQTPSRQFSTVHGINGSRDGLIYVADRGNSRVQVFRKNGQFVMEKIVGSGPGGTAFNVSFSPDREQTFLYLEDGANHQIWILRRSDLEIVGKFGKQGSGPGELLRPHGMASDSKGNLYVGEADNRRIQRFVYKGMVPPP